MPVTKVPVVHKFGIISYSQRLQLQERLLKQSFPEVLGSRQSVVQTSRLPLEITEEFIQQYNNAKSLDEKEKFEDRAQKMLERVKRRSGVRVGSQGQHINLPLAWTELSQLAQCKGVIQEDCLDVLIISLDQAPLERCHIPALFFLAETMLYWLRTDVIHQPYLRTGEIKLLKMGQLVFTRLFYHHMAGELHGEKEFKGRLFTYLDGLKDCQDAYRPYPNALLSLRFVIEVGKIVLADADLETGEVKEGDPVSSADQDKGRQSRTTVKDAGKLSPLSTRKVTTPKSLGSSARVTQYSFHSRQDSNTWDSKFFSTLSSKADETHSQQSGHSGALSSSIHDLSPTLWHSLDVWRCTNHLSSGLHHALRSLARCGSGLANETWIDTTCSMLILAEAAKTNLGALKVMQNLAKGEVTLDPPDSPPVSSRSNDSDAFSAVSEDYRGMASQASRATTRASLSDIFERSDEGDVESRVKRSDIASSSESSDRKSSAGKQQRTKSPGPEEKPGHGGQDPVEDEKSSRPDGGEYSLQDGKDSVLDGKDSVQDGKDSLLDGKDSVQDGKDSRQDGKDSRQDSRQEGRPRPVLRDPSISKPSTGREVSFDEKVRLSTLEEVTAPEILTLPSDPGPQPDAASRNSYLAQQDASWSRDVQDSHRPGYRPETGSSGALGRGSRASSVPTYTNQASVSTPGINGWHWETGIMYTDVMADICLHGNSSHIQKRALVGDNHDFRDVMRQRPRLIPLQSAGLLDLAFFHSTIDALDGSQNDWSWRIRYGAIHSLVKICRCLTNDRAKEGLRNVAWAALIHAHSKEKDDRVLEALKVGEVHSTLESLVGKHLVTPASVIGGRIAAGLVNTYLPPLPPPVSAPPSKASRARRSQILTSLKTPPQNRQPMRTALKDEIALATALHQPQPDFNTRMSFDLRRIVEDQWRKELQAGLEEEESGRQEELRSHQAAEEQRQRRLADNKAKKFSQPALSQ